MPKYNPKHSSSKKKTWIVKFRTTDGDVRTDAATYDNEDEAQEAAEDFARQPNVSKAWIE